MSEYDIFILKKLWEKADPQTKKKNDISITILFHNAFASLLEEKGWLIITSAYSSFLVWTLLMVIAFMSKNGWKIWGIYLSLIILFSITIYFNK